MAVDVVVDFPSVVADGVDVVVDFPAVVSAAVAVSC